MRLLVCGSRTWTNVEEVRYQLASLRPSVVIHGAANGADHIASTLAVEFGADVAGYPADWQNDGKAAELRRNARMLREGKPSRGLAFGALWKPGEPGTWSASARGSTGPRKTGTGDMVQRMLHVGLPVRWVAAPGAVAVDLETMPEPS